MKSQTKLDPSHVDSWNALGNCFWKKGDLAQAASCYEGALKQVIFTHTPQQPYYFIQARSAESLRNLSMLIRRRPAADARHRLSQCQESVSLAKEALSLDMGSTSSWYTLGTAHLCLYFAGQHMPDDLARALKVANHP